jgi:hypothetical protein
MPAQPLGFDVEQFIDADHWRWVLKEDGGAFLADHTVALDNAGASAWCCGSARHRRWWSASWCPGG